MNPITKRKYTHKHKKLMKKISNLPIYRKKNEIQEILDSDVIIIESETGSGKTVGFPIISIKHFQYNAYIILTQPRVVNIESVAGFIADQLDITLGDFVGYMHGRSRLISEKTRIIICTDSIFRKALSIFENKSNKLPIQIIIDEIHERSVYMDMILAYAKKHLSTGGKNIQFALLSATLDVGFFINYFKCDKPIKIRHIKLSGRSYEIEHQNINIKGDIKNQIETVVKTIIPKYNDDTLIFLPTKSLCRKALEIYKNMESSKNVFATELSSSTDSYLMPYIIGKLQYTTIGEYNRRVIFSTPIAETGITIAPVNNKGISLVIDFGLTNIIKFNKSTMRRHQTIEPTNMSSTSQRCGRAGRTQPGICLHINQTTGQRYNIPKILLESYTSLISQLLKNLGTLDLVMDTITYLPTPPDIKVINHTLLNMYDIGIIHHQKFSDSGIIATDLGIDVMYGMLIVESIKYNIAKYMIGIVSMISTDSKLSNWHSNTAKYRNQYGDPISFLMLWQDFINTYIKKLGYGWNVNTPRLLTWCKNNGWSYRLVRNFITIRNKINDRLLGYTDTILKLEKKEMVDIIPSIVDIFSSIYRNNRLLQINGAYMLYDNRIPIKKYWKKTKPSLDNLIVFDKPELLGFTDIIITEFNIGIPFLIWVIK